ncbi:hypothetical protein [Mycobacterium antarcticum]|uniref:hypothetical protein n=1 Tax=unclassified Mycolicibacterium TaxID=2636767 RepID=UPI0024E0CABE|nr:MULTISPECIES: hypothetical protein [unclassified Mycolicibacterium]
MQSFVASLAAALMVVVCSACGPAHGASGSSVVRPAAADGYAPGSDVPETLAAATAAAQATMDRFAAGDYAGVWEHMDRAVRAGITQEDFVTFYDTCKKAGQRLSVAGLRLQPENEAIVLVKVNGIERSRIMVYQDGVWNMQATDDFAAHLGEPVERIIAEEEAAGLCTR